MDKTVVELFAGVGGFRVGLNEVKLINDKVVEKDNFTFAWANQWEPSTKTQHAYDCYVSRFGQSTNHVNQDISTVDKGSIPTHSLLVGGFPCQDYSVARSLSNEKGIEGKKGVLWWQINDILEVKRPPFVLLENVDRLLKSPSKQRGRDFGVMLKCFRDLGYLVQWRVINAADYGHPQRRRRVFIFASHETTRYAKNLVGYTSHDIILHRGIFANSFPVHDNIDEKKLRKTAFYDTDSLLGISNKFHFAFENTGVLIHGEICTAATLPILESQVKLREILQSEDIPSSCFIEKSLEKFAYLKGAKRILREKNGVQYYYSEGGIAFPDNLEMPGRTMLTSEGTVNRSSHLIFDERIHKHRILTPVETERLNQFPDNWTNTGMPTKRRYFMMGNALVCGVIQKLGKQISSIIEKE